jgi:preprotein translocase subunit YajC
MNFWIMAAAAPAVAQPEANPIMTFLPIIVMVGAFWLILIMPQRKQQKQRATMMSSLKKGDKVVTIGGIHGEITAITDEDILLRISEKTEALFTKGSIARVKN